jgi:hypothetical protein
MEAKTANLDVSFNIAVPRSINIAQVTQNEIQKAFSGFFQQNPRILMYIFAQLKGSSVFPKTTKEQRKQMSLALRKLGNEDLEWTNNIIYSRKNKEYSYNFFGDE